MPATLLKFGQCPGPRTFRRGRRSGTRRRAAAVVELAIAFPVILLLILGAYDFGSLAFDYIILVHSARLGASMAGMDPPPEVDRDDWEQRVREAVSEEAAQVTGFDKTKLETQIRVVPLGKQQYVEVLVQHPYQFSGFWPGAPETITLGGRARMPVTP